MMEFNENNLRAVGVTTGSLIALRHFNSGRVSVCVGAIYCARLPL
jgi:hypothetical protein